MQREGCMRRNRPPDSDPLPSTGKTSQQRRAREALLGTGFLAVNKSTIAALGLRMAAYLASLASKYQLWEKKEALQADGSFYFSHQKQMEETGLSRWELRQCKTQAKEHGILRTRIEQQGPTSREFYHVDFERFWYLVESIEQARGGGSLQGGWREPPGGVEGASSKKEDISNKQSAIADMQRAKAKRSFSVKHEQLAIALVRACSARKALNGLTDTNKWPKQIALLCKALGPPNAEARVHRAIRFLEKMYQQYGMDSESQYIPTVESVKALREKFDKVEAAMHRSEKGSTGQLAYKDGKYGARKNGEPVDSTRRWFVVADEDPTTGEEFEDDMRLWRNNETDRYVLCPQYPEPLDGELHEDAREVDPALYGIGITS
jgi:hypothetical protein